MIDVSGLVVVLHALVEAVHPVALLALAFGFGDRLLVLHEWWHVWVEESREWWCLTILLSMIEVWWHHAKWEWEGSHWVRWKTIRLTRLALVSGAVVLKTAMAFANCRFLH